MYIKLITLFTNRKHSAAFRVLIAGVLVLSILLNGFASRAFAQSIDNDTMEKAIMSQSVLINVFIFSVLPMKIVFSLFDQYRNPKTSQPVSSKEKSRDSKGSSSDFSFVDLRTGSSILKTKLNRLGAVNDLQGGVSIKSIALTSGVAAQAPFGSTVFILFMLMLITLLPRGSIEASNIVYIIKSFYPTKII